ncbi:MAG TPA: sialic acid TRAP transporter substrate-binding protein SiaP, partial [Burkholderiales bacterium]|nr:sialic acid TRAP transporter substrate-binding protein SiaP [Burkholderiales bacterium]
MKKILILALLAFSTAGLAQQKLKFAHVYETTEPYHTYAVWAAGEIAKRTNNRYTMDVFPASQLGNETQINQALSLGTVDLIYTGQAFAARTHPPLSIGGAPYMFRDYDHWKKFSQSPVLAELEDAYFKKGGNKPIAAFYYGVRHTTANKAINKPEDMKGLKLRVPDAPLYIMYPKTFGANATPIAFAEVYLALQNKTVDAQENPLPTILAKKFYEVQTHINLTGHITEMLLAIVGGHVWSKASDADKKVFETVFREAAEKSNAEIVKSEQQLVTDFATKYGKTVVKSDREAFKKVATPFLTGKDVPWDKAL